MKQNMILMLDADIFAFSIAVVTFMIKAVYKTRKRSLSHGESCSSIWIDEGSGGDIRAGPCEGVAWENTGNEVIIPT